MKTLWILAAAATITACANRSDEEVGAAPDRGDTTAVTTEVDTATGTWDTTSTTGDVNAQPSDTAFTPTTPSDTTVGQYPTPSDAGADTTGYESGMGTDTTMTPSADTGAYVPDTGAAGVDTTGYESGMGTDSMPAGDPSAANPTADPTVPSTGDTGADTSGMDSGMGTDTTTSTSDPSVPADPGATDPNAETTPQ
jgi:hypothetical protein